MTLWWVFRHLFTTSQSTFSFKPPKGSTAVELHALEKKQGRADVKTSLKKLFVASALAGGRRVDNSRADVRTIPPNCVPVNYGGVVYQQCGTTWYLPQSGQYVVVKAPY